jgi:hypothetical protein
MSYSRRQLYALGEPIGDSATYKEGGRTIYGDGGGGGGGSQPQTSTTYSSNIPEYAKPYVETMLGAAQKQIYTTDSSGQATGFKPYTPYSTNMNDYVAGFSPMQQQAFSTVANLQVPTQYEAATGLAGATGLGSMGLSGQMARTGADYARMATDPRATQAYMSPYMQNVVDYQKAQAARDYQIQNQARQAQAVGAGAFGGSRQAIVQSEADRALQSQLQGITATGAQQAFQNAQQQQQFGAQLGLQGQQGALQGLGQALQSAQTIGQLGTSTLGAETQIAGLQQQMGAQQQQLEQQKINQAIQNYATAQQYPYMQLGILNSLLRGLPMQSTTTSSYQATPSTAQQIAGLGVTGLGAYKALSGFKEGGEVKGYASRGLAEVSRGVEGSVRAKLEMMSDQQLMQVAKTSQSAEVRAMAQEVLAEHKVREQAEMQAQQAINQERAAKPQIPQEAPAGLAAAPAPNMDNMGLATGGIIAFANEGLAEVDEEDPFADLDEKTRKIAERQLGVQRAFGVKENIYDPYKQFLTDKAAGLSKEKDYVKGMGLMDLGSRIASTPGPWGSALAQSISGALPGFQKGVADYKKQEADVYKAQMDVAKAENDAAMGKANKVGEAYEKLEDREKALQQTKMQVEGNIRAAGISASRETDLDKTTQAFLADRIANGQPDNAATRAAARKDALAATGFTGAKVATGQEQAVTTALDKDDDLKRMNKQLGLLTITPKQAEKNAKAIEDLKKQIADREKEVRNRVLRQEQVATPAAGAGTMRFDAQGNLIS